MKNYDVLNPFNEAEIGLDLVAFEKKPYAEKLKRFSHWVSETIQKGLLWATFLYIPVYFLLLYFNVLHFNSINSVYYLLSYFILILCLILTNRESYTFK